MGSFKKIQPHLFNTFPVSYVAPLLPYFLAILETIPSISSYLAPMSRPPINEAVRKQIRQFFNQLTLIFVAFLAGIFLFLISVLIATQSGDPKAQGLDMVLLITAPLSTMGMMLFANRLYQGRVKRAQDEEKLFQKMDAYRSATMLRFLLLDGAAFVQLGAFLLTENRVFIVVAIVVTTVFMFYRPHLERFVKDMALNDIEAKVMRDHAAKK